MILTSRISPSCVKLTRLKISKMIGMRNITATKAFITFCILYGFRYMFLQSPVINTICKLIDAHTQAVNPVMLFIFAEYESGG